MSARLFGEERPVGEGEDQDGAEALKSVAGQRGAPDWELLIDLTHIDFRFISGSCFAQPL